ncbi:hypothetical protein BpHYR1_004240 [Brachionus plicatilis]|uniref:Uncharacterized protein n=1 Tax=Brachionus plicatilis TaxID=10195 RepID=A0A3M7QBK6_BRAPC|nr:hypothetical protein BpHYR1_004240 [Brachionus plicatilis]
MFFLFTITVSDKFTEFYIKPQCLKFIKQFSTIDFIFWRFSFLQKNNPSSSLQTSSSRPLCACVIITATQQSAAKVTYGTFIINSATHPST